MSEEFHERLRFVGDELGVQAAFVFFIAFGRIVVGALVRQIVLNQVGVHLNRGPVEDGVHLEAVELGVPH